MDREFQSTVAGRRRRGAGRVNFIRSARGSPAAAVASSPRRRRPTRVNGDARTSGRTRASEQLRIIRRRRRRGRETRRPNGDPDQIQGGARACGHQSGSRRRGRKSMAGIDAGLTGARPRRKKGNRSRSRRRVNARLSPRRAPSSAPARARRRRTERPRLQQGSRRFRSTTFLASK